MRTRWLTPEGEAKPFEVIPELYRTVRKIALTARRRRGGNAWGEGALRAALAVRHFPGWS